MAFQTIYSKNPRSKVKKKIIVQDLVGVPLWIPLLPITKCLRDVCNRQTPNLVEYTMKSLFWNFYLALLSFMLTNKAVIFWRGRARKVAVEIYFNQVLQVVCLFKMTWKG